MKKPWMKFYPADWRAEPKLGLVSLAARGLWVECLCVMHQADPYGHLLVNGLKPSDEQLAALARAPVDQVRTSLQELENVGVFSRTRNGTIYSRRMTRDEKRRKDGETSAEHGTITGSRRYRQATEKPGENPYTPRVVDRVVDRPPSSQRPDARCQTTEKSKNYVFEGRVIRLLPDLWQQWRTQLSNLDETAFRRELMRADAYYAENPPKGGKWIFPVFNWLEKANHEASPVRRRTPMHPGAGG